MKQSLVIFCVLFSLFTFSQDGASPWGDPPDTDCNSTILLQANTSITLDGEALNGIYMRDIHELFFDQFQKAPYQK